MLPVEHGTTERKTSWASRFAGAWKDSRSAEEIINDICSARTSNTVDVKL